MEGREPSGSGREKSGLVRSLCNVRWEALREGWKLRPVANSQYGAAGDEAESCQERDSPWDADGELGGRRGRVQPENLTGAAVNGHADRITDTQGFEGNVLAVSNQAGGGVNGKRDRLRGVIFRECEEPIAGAHDRALDSDRNTGHGGVVRQDEGRRVRGGCLVPVREECEGQDRSQRECGNRARGSKETVRPRALRTRNVHR